MPNKRTEADGGKQAVVLRGKFIGRRSCAALDRLRIRLAAGLIKSTHQNRGDHDSRFFRGISAL
jgi:hypothetical protein